MASADFLANSHTIFWAKSPVLFTVINILIFYS